VHPYDDLDVAAARARSRSRCWRQQPALDTLVVAIGGGGMIGWHRERCQALKPGIQVIGVQTERFPAVWNVVHNQQRESAPGDDRRRIGVKVPGVLTAPLIKQHVDDVLLVGEDDIEQAILMLLEIEKTVVEGAGAVGLAALMKHRARFAGPQGRAGPLRRQHRAAGAGEIIQRGMVKSGRLARLRWTCATCRARWPTWRRCSASWAPTSTRCSTSGRSARCRSSAREIEVVVHTRGVAHIEEILAAMRAQGYRAERIG
jgi:threonine dehydratase